MNKYTSNTSSDRRGDRINNVYLAEVVSAGKITISDDEIRRIFEPKDFDKIKKSLQRYNSDDHAIKVVIPGTKWDGSGDHPKLLNLPNCFPLMPKHINFVPKVGEMVLVIAKSYDERFDDRFYIGPIISSRTKLEKDTTTTATSNLSVGITQPSEDVDRVPSANGIYENPQNVVIEGRGSTDIIQRSDEILLRSGKFVRNNRLKFNYENPGYIQIKSDFKYNPEGKNFDPQISVTNIVSDKINLLTYNGSPTLSDGGGLVRVNRSTGSAEYINDAKLKEILEKAHPLVFGDLLLEYLLLLKNAFINHVHNGWGFPPCDIYDNTATYDFVTKSRRLEEAMLSKNIRIN